MIFGVDGGKIIESNDWCSDKSSFRVSNITFEPASGFSFETIKDEILKSVVSRKKYIDLRAVANIKQADKS